MQPSTLVVWGGFAIAFAFGAIANQANFCTMGALSDVVHMGHWGRVRMWLLAVAVALVGASALQLAGLVDLSRSVYQRPTLNWLSLAFGGTLFGIGMTLAGGCANKNLVRLGGGSLRSLVVLVFVAIASYMTLKGLFGAWRVRFLDPVSIDLGAWGAKDQSLATLVARASGLAPAQALALSAGVIALALLIFVFKDRRFRANGSSVAAGLLLGLLVTAAWALSGHLGHGENPDTLETVYFATNSHTIESLSFVAPLAYTLEMLMLWTDASLHMSLGIASVLGVALGSLAYSLASRRFRWEGFASLADLRNQLIGGVLMGFGGVTATGCTIGQGISGLSTLAIGSVLAVAAIVGGSVATLKAMAWQAERET
ncbi:MAG: YeeE/YedE family protein [Burkholderiales bacterium]|nr:YeeE/YedE family protein [Burkholderiales bacterium]